jgi:UDP-GlcNAc:undecaprenyl-phosphate GlcNAc-1-phosphate transferase
MVTLGNVQLAFIYLPWGDSGTFVLGQDLSIPITILLTVLTINAVNFIDGLDGLAAGVTAIGAMAFFAFSYHLGQGSLLQIAAAPTLISAALAGTCIGFLPHNFFPARIFMGDSGSMLVGLMLSAAAITATTNVDPQGFGSSGSTLFALPLALPLIVPVSILAIPFVDLVLAVVRRLSKRKSPFAPDKKHLHHRLLALGHSHRRAVLLLYFWSALLAFGGTALSIYRKVWVWVLVIALGILLGVLLLVVPRLSRRGRRVRPTDQATPVTAAKPAQSAQSAGIGTARRAR